MQRWWIGNVQKLGQVTILNRVNVSCNLKWRVTQVFKWRKSILQMMMNKAWIIKSGGPSLVLVKLASFLAVGFTRSHASLSFATVIGFTLNYRGLSGVTVRNVMESGCFEQFFGYNTMTAREMRTNRSITGNKRLKHVERNRSFLFWSFSAFLGPLGTVCGTFDTAPKAFL